MRFNSETKSIIKGTNKKKCIMCGEMTEYIDTCSEAHMCSTECVDKFYEEYNKTVASMPELI